MVSPKEQSVYGERIKEAREMKGYSQTILAGLINVKRQAVSAFEKDKIKPSPETLFAISSVTGFPVPFFLNERPRGDSKRTAPISFRKKAAATKTTLLQAEQWENLLADTFFCLTDYLEFSPHKIPFYGEIDYLTLSDAKIEVIATEVRRSWGLGDGPIPNFTRLLENNGILIGKAKLPVTLDAYATWRNERPFILLSDGGKTSVRRRFNEAHELGHLVLHVLVDEQDFKNTETLKRLENQANRFAGAFLFPQQSVSNEYFSHSLSALTQLKSRWKISIAAIAKRLCDLGYIGKDQLKYIMIHLGDKRKREPLDNTIPMEEPSAFERAFDTLIKNNLLSIRRVLDELFISDEVFSTLTGINLKTAQGPDNIIPFRVK